MEPRQLLDGMIWFAVLIFSLTFHEAAHAWAARRGGDLTAYLGGQVTLDPRPHIRREPFGMVLVPLLSFALSDMRWMIGWASTPFDLRWALAHPRRAAWMSLAGPAANFVLVIAAGFAIRFGIFSGVFAVPAGIDFTGLVAAPGGGVAETLATLVSVLFTLNLLLGVFNLIPVPPLDGSGALGLVLPEGAARRAQLMLRQPTFSLLGILVAWMLIGRIFGPIHLLAINLLYPEATYR